MKKQMKNFAILRHRIFFFFIYRARIMPQKKRNVIFLPSLKRNGSAQLLTRIQCGSEVEYGKSARQCVNIRYKPKNYNEELKKTIIKNQGQDFSTKFHFRHKQFFQTESTINEDYLVPPKKAFIGRTRLLWVMKSIPFKPHKISKAISLSSVIEIHPPFQYLKLLGFPQPFPALRHQRYDARRATVFAKRLFNNQSSERFFVR